MPPDTPARMPNGKQQHGQHNRHELQRAKVHLRRAQISTQPLGRLRQTEHRPQINQQRRHRKRRNKRHQAALPQLVSRPKDKHPRQDNKQPNRKHLIRQAPQQDIIRRSRILSLRLLRTNQRRPGNLRHRSNRITRDKEPQNNPRRQDAILPSQPINQRRENGIYPRSQKHRRRDDEKVLQDKVDEVVGVLFGREQTCDVADDLEEEAHAEGRKVPGLVADELEDVDEKKEEEEDHAEEGEGEGGRVAVDDYGGVVGAAGGGPVGVDVASAAGSACGIGGVSYGGVLI